MNHLNLNIKNCNILSFSHKQSTLDFIYNINGILLSRLKTFSDLGVTFDPNLSFSDNIYETVAKASRNMGSILRSKVN